MQDKSGRVKITNPERLLRIFKRLCDAHLRVLVRRQPGLQVAVRGQAETLLHQGPVKSQLSASMILNHISERGMQHLEGTDMVQVEFVMMSTKIVLQAKITNRRHNSIFIALPDYIVSIERRSNARHKVTGNLGAYLSLNTWPKSADTLTRMPTFSHQDWMAQTLYLDDISIGGASVSTMYPAICSYWYNGKKENDVTLQLPLQTSFPAPVEVRWLKITKEYGTTSATSSISNITYRFGLQFLQNEHQQSIQQYIQQLDQDEAI